MGRAWAIHRLDPAGGLDPAWSDHTRAPSGCVVGLRGASWLQPGPVGGRGHDPALMWGKEHGQAPTIPGGEAWPGLIQPWSQKEGA